MVRKVASFVCEWCEGQHPSAARAVACEKKDLAKRNREGLARMAEGRPYFQKRLELYDRLAKEHGIGQEESDGKA